MRAPITAPTLLAVAVFLVWTPLDGGQPITRWAPGAIVLLALLGLALVALPPLRWSTLPGTVRVAALALAAFTAWSFLSIAWADDGGVALEGADRTLLYLVAFLLFALWPQRPATAAWVLGLWTFGIGALALVTLVRIGTVADPATLFDGDRLTEPVGYANAEAATWLMALWPAVTLAASARVPWPVRGLAAALAVVLLDVALLSQSRGSILALPVCALLFVAIVPGRLRTIAVLVPMLGAAALALPKVLDVGDALERDRRGRRAGRGRRGHVDGPAARAGRGRGRRARRRVGDAAPAGARDGGAGAQGLDGAGRRRGDPRRGRRPGRRRQPGRPARQRLALVQGRLRRQHGQRQPPDRRARIQPL